MNILISSLGAQPDIIEETVGLFNYSETCDFYKDRLFVDEMRSRVERVDEVWLISTDQPHTSLNDREFNSTLENFEYIKSNCSKYGVELRIFILKSVKDIASASDASAFHDLTLRVVTYAKKCLKGGRLYVSLACGRKTMSADMQDVAYCFGCDMLIHVLGDRKEDAQPILLGGVFPNEALKPMKITFSNDEVIYCDPKYDYYSEILHQKTEAQHFFTSYYLDEKETRSNFHILYTLPPSKIEQLKKERIGVDKKSGSAEMKWLKRLPKTDLHCHLGGVILPEELMEVTSVYDDLIGDYRASNQMFRIWEKKELKLLCQEISIRNFKSKIRQVASNLGVFPGVVARCIYRQLENENRSLRSFFYEDYENEANFKGVGIQCYEQLGDLQGSTLLQLPSVIRNTLMNYARKCQDNNVKYLEVRCSPLNYVSKVYSAEEIVKSICHDLRDIKKNFNIETSLIFIVSRHKENLAKEYVKLVLSQKTDPLFKRFFRGFDVAGNEAAKTPEQMRKSFIDILKECYNITIHAGEDQPVENIWEAVYHLSAERIGHGLTLQDNEELLNKFLERGIGIEMCPSSNYQIVGYRDNYYQEDMSQSKEYPLKKYLNKGLLVSVNTDDPGISLTDVTHELHKAARMTEGGLSKWEILQLVCNGFRTAFYPYEKKKELIRIAENCIGDLIKRDLL